MLKPDRPVQPESCIRGVVSLRVALWLVALTACATDGPSNVYRKPGATQAMYDKDISDCEHTATSRPGEPKGDRTNRCMMGKGWIVTRERN
jgi:hypothetical protein